LSLAVATHSARYTAWLALIVAGFGEWRRISSRMYYVLVAIAISAAGFLAQSLDLLGQYWNEPASLASGANSYVVTAFLLTGFVAGLVYWLFAGRFAGGRRDDAEVIPPPKSASSGGRPARIAT
jgi:hypothetical protein